MQAALITAAAAVVSAAVLIYGRGSGGGSLVLLSGEVLGGTLAALAIGWLAAGIGLVATWGSINRPGQVWSAIVAIALVTYFAFGLQP